MGLPRSCTLLKLVRRQTGGTTNLIFRNASEGSKASACSAPDITKSKAPNENFKDCDSPGNVAPKSAGYVDRLTSDGSISTDTKNENKDLTTMVNKLKESYGMSVLGNDADTINDALEDVNEKLPGPLDPCNEDLSDIGSYTTPTFNFAKFANDSYTIQQLVKLGVELYKLEKDRDLVEMYLSLDFDKDMKPYIRFLHDCGVEPENLGQFITKNPKIFKEDMDDLHTRIRYLRAHKFTPELIKEIVNKNPIWLSFKTQEIDGRLGHFQHTFKLNGYQVRSLAVKCPRLITYNMPHLRENTFAVKEEMGFDSTEMQLLLMKVPRVWMCARIKVVNSFDYAHNQMNLSHAVICMQPQILLCRRKRLEERHQFLVNLKRDQYDPLKPLYVSPLALISGTDLQFCMNVAKASIDTYNMFLKTL
ncbi:mitochondrial transcription termination factor 3 [Andrena cerasifolii]|uniref:mitochondrial transcription termination factor 3 n=1 Tax=Andrena cerasifolii TaxID=2819439 RepID=UPI00403824D1